MDSQTSQKIMLAATAVSELCRELPECIIIRDSLASYRKRKNMPGMLLHNLPIIEFLIALDRNNLGELKKRFSSTYGNGGMPQRDAEEFLSGKINFMEHERTTGDLGLLAYQFIELKALEKYCELASPLVWNEAPRSHKLKEFYGFSGKKAAVPLSTVEYGGSYERYSLPPLADGRFYAGIRSALLCRSIVLQNKNRFYERAHERAWKSAAGQLALENSQNPEKNLSVLNSFDVYHKNSGKVPKRLENYLERKTREYLTLVKSSIFR